MTLLLCESEYEFKLLIFDNMTFQVGFDAKTGGLQTNGFPNQLISLSHIRNYAHQPPTADLLHTLKEKAGV